MRFIRYGIAVIALLTGSVAHSADPVKLAIFSWPGYGFWFIAKE